MRTKDRNMMLDFFVKQNMINAKVEVVSQTKEEEVDKVDEEDIGTTSDGRPYIKSAVRDYLLEKGYPFTQETVDVAAKVLFPEGMKRIVKETQEMIQQTELDDASDDEFMEFVQFQTLKNLVEIKELLKSRNQREYAVEVIKDNNTGEVDTSAINNCLIRYSAKGWILKCAFTDEIGKNAIMGINATIEQVVLIFERSVKPKI